MCLEVKLEHLVGLNKCLEDLAAGLPIVANPNRPAAEFVGHDSDTVLRTVTANREGVDPPVTNRDREPGRTLGTVTAPEPYEP